MRCSKKSNCDALDAVAAALLLRTTAKQENHKMAATRFMTFYSLCNRKHHAALATTAENKKSEFIQIDFTHSEGFNRLIKKKKP